jgi:hypothetical protein
MRFSCSPSPAPSELESDTPISLSVRAGVGDVRRCGASGWPVMDSNVLLEDRGKYPSLQID